MELGKSRLVVMAITMTIYFHQIQQGKTCIHEQTLIKSSRLKHRVKPCMFKVFLWDFWASVQHPESRKIQSPKLTRLQKTETNYIVI
jgi:hypothetical protein